MSSVDVIVPCYRYGHFLRQCVGSVLAESRLNIRVLIIDDASPDDSAEVAAQLAKENARVTFLRHITNKGHIATYNEGIEWASADYLVLISADDYLLPDALSRAVNLMDAHPEVGFTFGRVIELFDDGTRREPRTLAHAGAKRDCRILGGLEFIELSGSFNLVPAPSVMVKTALQKRVGGYRPELPHSGDMEMWLRLAAHASVGIFETCQAVYRRHTSNMSWAYYTSNRLQDVEQRRAALNCFFKACNDTLPNAERLRRSLFRSLGRDAVQRAHAAFNDGEIKVSEQLSQIALSVCPEVRRSVAWIKLACKRSIGSGAWGALRPAVARLRKAAAALKLFG